MTRKKRNYRNGNVCDTCKDGFFDGDCLRCKLDGGEVDGHKTCDEWR